MTDEQAHAIAQAVVSSVSAITAQDMAHWLSLARALAADHAPANPNQPRPKPKSKTA